MTQVEREFLKILESFMHDKEYHFPENFTALEEMKQLSGIHNVVAMVYEQIRGEEIWKKADFQTLEMQFRKTSIYKVMTQVQRTETFLRVYKHLCEEGICPLVVKGIICRNFYTKPDYRVSGDEDMLICKADFEMCDKILRQEGFTRSEFDTEHMPYEIPYMHRKTGTYIELHFSLFSEEVGAYGYLNKEFQYVFENCICEKIQGIEIFTLNPTEHMFYLICHSFKHFLHSGFGIRQVCDMVMMAERYGKRIDWKKINIRLSELNMTYFWSGLSEIGRKYLGFDWKRAGYNRKFQKEDIELEDLIQDILKGGIYGDSSMERKHSSNMTLAAVTTGKKSTIISLKESLFPSGEYMKQKYSWLEKSLFLLPVAWGMRICTYLLKKEHRGQEEVSGLEIGMERVELLKKYKIIK